MNSLRLSFFLLISLAGHAAVLIPASNALVALFDGEPLDANDVVVAVSVISHPNPGQATNRFDRLYHAFSEQGALIHPPVPPRPTEQVRASTMGSRSAAVADVSAAVDPPTRDMVKDTPLEPHDSAATPSHDVVRPLEAEPAEDQSLSESSLARATPSNQSEARRLRLQAEGQYLAELLQAISRHRTYPSSARKRGHDGVVEIELIIRRDGSFESVQIANTSNHRMLDKASERAVRKLKRFKPFPREIDRESWKISIPFRYVLQGGGEQKS